MPVVNLPNKDGRLEPYRLAEPRAWKRSGGQEFSRVALAAGHLVADPMSDADPWLTAAIDWDATIAYRRHLWSLGLGVAEAMDTAQRGTGLDWPNASEADPAFCRSGPRPYRVLSCSPASAPIN